MVIRYAIYVFLRFVFKMLSTKYGFYTAKYGQMRQMTGEKNNLRAKTGQLRLLTETNAFRGSRQVSKKYPKEREYAVFDRGSQRDLVIADLARSRCVFQNTEAPSPFKGRLGIFRTTPETFLPPRRSNSIHFGPSQVLRPQNPWVSSGGVFH